MNIRQKKSYHCGVAVAYAAATSFITYEYVAKLIEDKEGTHPLQIINFLKSVGLAYLAGEPLSVEDLKNNFVLCPIRVNGYGHWVIVYGVTKKYILYYDPLLGKVRRTHKKFVQDWRCTDKDGILYIQYGIIVRAKK